MQQVVYYSFTVCAIWCQSRDRAKCCQKDTHKHTFEFARTIVSKSHQLVSFWCFCRLISFLLVLIHILGCYAASKTAAKPMARSWLLLAAAAAAVVEAVPVMRSNRAASRLPGDPFNKGDTTICHPPTQMAKTPWSPVTDTKRQLDFRAGVLAYTPDSIKSLNGSPK